MKKDHLLTALSTKLLNELNFKILKSKDNEKPRRYFLLTSMDPVKSLCFQFSPSLFVFL